MSKIKKPIVTDDTAKQIVDKLHTQNLLLNVIADSAIETAGSLDEIHRIVQSGNAAKVFNIGDQIIVPWKDKASNVTYQAPLDIVHFGNVTLQDGETVPAMFLQWHYCTPFGVQFDAREAFYVAPSGGLAAGTYTFNVPTAWSKILSGDYQFTVAEDLAEGTLLVLKEAYVDVNTGLAGGIINVFANGMATSPTTTITISTGSSGTSLGEFKAAGDTDLNSIQCANYGFNNWAKSAIRQWLNSDGAPEAWWSSKHAFDMRPAELATKHGFMSGFEDDFLATLKPIKVDTAKNTVNEDGALETTYDTFFLPALVNLHVNPQLSGEGDIFEYWKRISQSSTPLAQYGTYPQMRVYAIENHSSPQSVRLRSAGRGYAYGAWHVFSSGCVSYNSASYSYRCAPVCAMC
jgi:hypothetical protein